MNLRNMEYFLAAAREDSLTKAAEKLHISQQALSGAIRRMESELACTLFDRENGFCLTYAGRKYLDAVSRILSIHRQAASEIDDIEQNARGELRFGISHSRGQAILPRILPDFMARYPMVEITLLEDSTEMLEKALEDGEIDLMVGFAPFMTECAEYYPLEKEQLCLVLSRRLLSDAFPQGYEYVLENYRKTRDLRLFRRLPFVLLKEGDRVRTLADRAFKNAGIDPLIRLETENTQTAIALASEGVGITVSPELYLNSPYTAAGMGDSYIRERVVILPLSSGQEEDTIAIGYNKDRYLSHAASDFITMCIERFRDASAPFF